MVAQASPVSATDLASVNIELTRMAGLVETQLAGAINALERRDLAAAAKIVANDQRIDLAQADIEARVLDVLQMGGGAPAQIREILMMMKVAGEMERIGDLAKNVAKRTQIIAQERDVRLSFGLLNMGRAALRQFSDILNALSKRDVDAAKAVWGADDDIDALYNSIFKELLVAMMEDPGLVNACTHLVFIAKNFERVGDHATNIAEALHYVLTGAPLDFSRPKGDETSTTAVRLPS